MEFEPEAEINFLNQFRGKNLMFNPFNKKCEIAASLKRK
jgi:hypothetical protein